MERAGDILKSAFKDSLGGKGRRYASFFSAWEKILGEEPARNLKLTDIRNDTLLITASHPAWSQLIVLKKEKLIAVINRLYPEFHIKNIRVSLHSGTKSAEKNTILPAGNGIAGDIDLKDELKNMKNGDLKEVLKKLYKSIRKKPQKGDNC
jgi:hypothetical protein